ncbi:MAG: bifunctional diaminohydroxyphosphoribosylaminopyrimidine deaminase/5-amino-6-(5-phosphoribosylamino)uracil reductase RibD, partial [Bacteroidales bacterium]
MKRSLELASLGLENVHPNPMVGAVLVYNDQIIGEGWHQQYGKAHAEINAFNSVKYPELISKSTLYVNLEPCSHFGKTPPCADAIIQYRVPKVVMGPLDINSKVNGKGVKKLQEAGIEVIDNILHKECLELNKRFFTFHTKKRPYIILKWARTRNNYMDIERNGKEDIQKYWITNPELKVITHKWRSEEAGILVGFNTMKNDQPQLTTRLYPGKDPQRFVMQRGEEIIASALPYIPVSENLSEAMATLYQQNILSIMVEGGKKTLEKFIAADLWDEVRILTGNQYWNQGVPAPGLG